LPTSPADYYEQLKTPRTLSVEKKLDMKKPRRVNTGACIPVIFQITASSRKSLSFHGRCEPHCPEYDRFHVTDSFAQRIDDITMRLVQQVSASVRADKRRSGSELSQHGIGPVMRSSSLSTEYSQVSNSMARFRASSIRSLRSFPIGPH
jgi:hypothetical protein